MLERLILQGLLLALFLATSAFLAAAEAAYFSLSRLGTAHLEPEESPGHALLAKVLLDKVDNARDRLFRVLGLAHPLEDFVQMYRGIVSGRRDARASATGRTTCT